MRLGLEKFLETSLVDAHKYAAKEGDSMCAVTKSCRTGSNNERFITVHVSDFLPQSQVGNIRSPVSPLLISPSSPNRSLYTALSLHYSNINSRF